MKIYFPLNDAFLPDGRRDGAIGGILGGKGEPGMRIQADPCVGGGSQGAPPPLLHAEEFDFENQRGVGRDHAACAACAIAEI